MNTYYVLFVIFLIQLSIKYGKTQIITEADTCEGGEKVQYGHHFECICPANMVHETPAKCIDKSTLSTCSDADSAGKPCGEFATCQLTTGTTYECKCIENYTEPKGRSLKIGESGCTATACASLDCGNAVCRLENNKDPICSCKIGYVRETELTKNSKCSNTGDKIPCDLKCPGGSVCDEHKNGYYYCKCDDGNPVIDGVCSSAYKLFLSPLNIIFILVVSFISLKSA